MSTFKKLPLSHIWTLTTAILIAWPLVSVAKDPEHYGIGRPATQAEIQDWNIDISPNGEGLPSGQGTAKEGATVYTSLCASCHGTTGIEGPMPKLVGGKNSLTADHPLKTVGSYWPFATTLYDYIYRAMPPTAPQSLSPNQVYSVIAWILFSNGIIEETLIVDEKTLPTIKMPNKNGFVRDTRPNVSTNKP